MSHGACQQREHLSQRNYRKAFHVNVVLIAAPRANLLGAVVRIRCPKNCTRTVKPIPQVRVRVSVCLFLSLSLSIPLFVSVAATLSLSRSLSPSSSVYLSFSLSLMTRKQKFFSQILRLGLLNPYTHTHYVGRIQQAIPAFPRSNERQDPHPIHPNLPGRNF